jgi:hypothetical protein
MTAQKPHESNINHTHTNIWNSRMNPKNTISIPIKNLPPQNAGEKKLATTRWKPAVNLAKENKQT